MNQNRFTQKSMEALRAMQTVASENGNPQIEPVHLLSALVGQENGLIGNLIRQAEIDPAAVQAKIDEAIARLPKVTGADSDRIYLSRTAEAVLNEAEAEAQKMKDEYISVEHLMLALFSKGDPTVKDILRAVGLTRDAFLTVLRNVRGNRTVTGDNPENTYDALNKYGQDLTEKARSQKLDPVIGRDEEIRNVIRILSRKTKNNP